MHKLSKEEQPTYVLGYPRPVRLARLAFVVLLAAAALVRWGLAWVRFVTPLIAAVRDASQAGVQVGPALTEALGAQPLWPLIAAHLGLLLAAGAIACVYAFLPDLALADPPDRALDGGSVLAARLLGGWHIIPWEMITSVRILHFEKDSRRLVLIQGAWTRWSPWPRLVSLCLAAGPQPGLLYTSDIRDFRPLTRRLYDQVKHAAPDATFDDDVFSLPAHLALEPARTLTDLIEEARAEEGWPLSISAQAMAAVPAGLVLVQLLLFLFQGGAWWQLLVIVGLCELEWLLGAFYLYALAEMFPARVEFNEALLLYPMVQVPRALLAVLMALFVAAGAPALAVVAGLAGVLWAVALTTLLVQRLFRLPSLLPATPGAVVQALFQFMILIFVLTG